MTEYPARESPVDPARDGVDALGSLRAAFFRAKREGRPVCALVMTLENGRQLAARHGDGAAARVRDAVLGWLRESLPGRELLLVEDGLRAALLAPGASLAEVSAAARRAIERGRAGEAVLDGAALRPRLAAGVADGARRDAAWVETVLEVAAEGAAVAGAAGGNRCVHTEVYEHVQARLARELPEWARRPPEPEPPPAPSAPSARAPAAEERDPDAASAAEPAQEAPPPPAQVELPEDLERSIERRLLEDVEAEQRGLPQRRIVDFAMERARIEWERAASRLASRHAEEIERLERRIAKLSEALEGAERRMAENGRDDSAGGVASAFRSVQGLSETEQDHELKRELMGMIFKANLELYRQLGRV